MWHIVLPVISRRTANGPDRRLRRRIVHRLSTKTGYIIRNVKKGTDNSSFLIERIRPLNDSVPFQLNVPKFFVL